MRVLAALLSVIALGMWFNASRPLAITATAVLTFMYPQLLLLVLAGTALVIWFRYFRK